MISRELALALREACLTWHPESGDRFQLDLRLDDAFEVEVEVAGSRMRFEHPDVAEAYGLALLELIGRSR